MRRHVALFAALALAVSAPRVLSAQDSNDVKQDRKEVRHDRRELRGDRKDIRHDTRDIRQDRREVRQDLKSGDPGADRRSEEHTSELQSPCNLVCRLLLEKKK